MFEYLLPLYQDGMTVIRIDFLGNGQSERVGSFPEEMWIDQGHQIVELCRSLNCGKVNLVGTSGGAYAAINAALEKPQLFRYHVFDTGGHPLIATRAEEIAGIIRGFLCDE